MILTKTLKLNTEFAGVSRSGYYHYLSTENLRREIEEHGPRKILLTDITYIINGKAPRCYMSLIIDACTKELLSWVLSESLEIENTAAMRRY